VRAYCASRFANASRLFLCGMSTGAFLSLAAAARPSLALSSARTEVEKCAVRRWQKLRLRGVFVLACVDDIPSSVSVDFSEAQRQHAAAYGWCYTSFWPWAPPQKRSNQAHDESVAPPDKLPTEPEQWRLGRGYLDSYQQLPPTATLRYALRVPLLLLHGDQDTHVSVSHSHRLVEALAATTAKPSEGNAAVEMGRNGVSLGVLKGGNHFLSSSKAMKQSLAAIRAFVKEHNR
jgi:pimeloyl-ACP methyl ester carboxylesterase